MLQFKDLGLTADNIRIEDHETLFFAPMLSTAQGIQPLLKQAGIKYRIYNRREVQKRLPVEMQDVSQSEIDAWMQRFADADYPDALVPELLVSHCNTDDLFEKSKLFFGKTIDPKFKEYKEQWEKRSHEHFVKYKDYYLGTEN